jgi:hypothetical protein
MYPGEYIDPLPRVSNVQCAMISGYACARVRREDPIFFPASGDADMAQVYLSNTGKTNFTVQMKQTREEAPPGKDSTSTPTGTRFNVGAAELVVPGGTKTLDVSPWMEFLEFWCTTGDNHGFLRAQITGKVRWEKMAFDKSETIVAPQILNSVKLQPVNPLTPTIPFV